MKKTITHIGMFLALTLASAQAHPGHPGHEDWPFPDFKWSLALGAAMLIGIAIYKLRSKV
ncbi:MAG: hypothetical protein ACPH2J_10360 [Akkermansiaceae bacterium]